jgi:hypothetical protein
VVEPFDFREPAHKPTTAVFGKDKKDTTIPTAGGGREVSFSVESFRADKDDPHTPYLDTRRLPVHGIIFSAHVRIAALFTQYKDKGIIDNACGYPT